MKLRRREAKPPKIFTDSMADVSFLLIIFFMVTAAFAVTKGLEQHNETDTGPVEAEHAIDVNVLGGGALEVDGRAIPFAELLAYIKPKIEQNPHKPVILRTEAQATYGDMVIVLDELNLAPAKLGFEIRDIAIPTIAEVQRWKGKTWID